MEVDGDPNVRVCAEPARAGAVQPQNVSARSTATSLSVVDKVGGPFTPVGFYYRRDPAAPGVAGYSGCSGTSPGSAASRAGRRPRRSDVEHRLADVLVVGGGRSGHAAARTAAAAASGWCWSTTRAACGRRRRGDRARHARSASTRAGSCR